MHEEEIQLHGGNVSTVVRIGDTVRRMMGPWSPTLHDFLRYLETHGFNAAPRFLGIDQQEREILSFTEGEVGNYPLQHYMWNDTVLSDIAHMIRQFHDLSANYRPPHDAHWQNIYPDLRQHEIICHNDLAPYNMVYHNGKPLALIDFDTAGPGPRLWDLAHAAYRFIPLLHLENIEMLNLGLLKSQTQARRLQLFCDAYAYGQLQPRAVLSMVEPRLQALCTLITTRAAQGDPAFKKMLDEGHLAHYQRELAALPAHFHQIEQYL